MRFTVSLVLITVGLMSIPIGAIACNTSVVLSGIVAVLIGFYIFERI